MVIPIKDERDNLHPLTTQLLKTVGQFPESQQAPFEIIFVNDGSTDGSGPILDGLAAQYPEVRVLHLDRCYGQTAAFDAGFRYARAEIIATMDGDLQYEPADIATLLPHLQEYDLVCGRRERRLDHVVRRVSSRIAFWVRNAVVRDGITDTGCSLKLFRRAVVEQIPLFTGMHRFFPALAQMYGFTVTEVPVRHFPRAHGQSKYGIGNRLFAGLYDLIAVRWMQSRCYRFRIVRTSPDFRQPHR
ncbi:MAG: glycosyltransferase [Nitrospirae bacterium]|nr:MAG: glycosyltransferase [Nitrospirota bacterium]